MPKKSDMSDILANIGNKRCNRCDKESKFADFGDLPFLCDDCRKLEKEEHAEVSAAIKNQVSFHYDVDAILDETDFLGAFQNHLPNPWDAEDSQLFPEERVIRGIAEFAGMCGNGIKNLVENENFDVIDRSITSASQIENCLLSTAMSELSILLQRFTFPNDPDDCVDHYFKMTDDQNTAFEAALEELDKKYFYGDESLSLWNHAHYLESTKGYARLHREKLATRKA